MKKIMKLLGFEEDETGENRRRKPSHSSSRDENTRSNAYDSNYEDYDDDEKYKRPPSVKNGLIFFSELRSCGVNTTSEKEVRKLCPGVCCKVSSIT